MRAISAPPYVADADFTLYVGDVRGVLQELPGTYPFAHGAWRPAWRKHVLPVVWPWMTLEESHDAIPPAYTEWIGGRLLQHLQEVAA